MIRLVTPGTLTEEKLLDPSEANFLMALGRTRGEGTLALAWIDISTGTFRVSETAPDRLFADIMRVDPRELVVADTAFHDAELRPVFDLVGKAVTPQPATLLTAGRLKTVSSAIMTLRRSTVSASSAAWNCRPFPAPSPISRRRRLPNDRR